MNADGCIDCSHFYICCFKNCGKCGKHLHDDGKEVEA